ncbi:MULTISPECIES: hypothetical protein [unclassified Streptomyces]|uniref:hypothetical protein n=1 Tax=unclassified Streptomyces TaxID=2593676 RepID=UPI0033200847
MPLLPLIAFSLIAFTLVARITGRITDGQAYAGDTLATFLMLIWTVREQAWLFSDAFSAAFAVTLWHWWNNGGGTGTRRRFRELRRRFQGVRRTASQTA